MLQVQSFIAMLVLILCLCQTLVIQRLGEKHADGTEKHPELRKMVDRVGRQALVGAGGACAIGFILQLWALQPSAASPSLPGGVFSELQTDAAASHLWPWVLFGLLWLAVNVGRIWWWKHREKIMKWWKHRKKMQSAAKSETSDTRDAVGAVVGRSKV